MICVSPYYIPSNKKFRLDSTFCKVLSAKSVVFTERKNRFPLLYPLRASTSPYGFRSHKVLFTKSVVFVKREIICFPLRYPLRLFFRKGHQNYYAKSKQLIVSHIRLNFVFPYGIPSDKTAPPNSPFCKVLSAKSVVPLRLARGTKITTLNQRAVRKDSPFHIRCDLCFPLLYPLRLFARDTKILTLNQSKNCFSYTLEFCFPLR